MFFFIVYPPRFGFDAKSNEFICLPSKEFDSNPVLAFFPLQRRNSHITRQSSPRNPDKTQAWKNSDIEATSTPLSGVQLSPKFNTSAVWL